MALPVKRIDKDQLVVYWNAKQSSEGDGKEINGV